MATNCDNFTILSDLDTLESLSRPDIDVLIRACPQICFILLGEGNQDIFGIGVSFKLQSIERKDTATSLTYHINTHIHPKPFSK